MVDFSFHWPAAFLILFGVWFKGFFCNAVETFASRSYFYVGGHYENTVSSHVQDAGFAAADVNDRPTAK